LLRVLRAKEDPASSPIPASVMTASRLRIPLELILVPCLIAAIWAIHGSNTWLEARRVERISDGNVGVLPDGATLRVLSLGFERLVADLFWIRTVYYVGDEHASAAKWPGAERLANLVVDVDPHFDSAYVIMSSVLGTLRHDPDAAIRLLEKGAAVSSYWRIHFLLGFQYFMEKDDYVRGAASLERAFELGGPSYLQFLISRLYTHAGDPDTAMQFVAARLQNEESPQIRAELEKRLSDLWITRDLECIEVAMQQYHAAHGREARDVRALVEAKLLPELPRDPKGGAYRIENGRATANVPYERIELFQPR
jgi:hypothetical protein